MKRYIQAIVVIVLVLLLYKCVHRPAETTSAENTIVTVSAKSQGSTLYFSGIVQPLKTIVVTTPAEGVISDMTFHFGDEVKPGQLLFSISSDKFQTDYKSALMAYIKAKTDYVNGQSLMREGQFLHKNQLISDDDFKAKQTGYYNAQLAMVQAKDTLDDMLKQMDLHGMSLYDLKIEDIDKIIKLLHAQSAQQQIHIVAPAAGVVLLPSKGEGLDGELKKVLKGDQVKQGDLLAVIGDVSGLTIHISVSEFNINQLKIGQVVHVTGAAFPDFILQGKISGINRQAEASQGGLPVFPIEIIVPKLTPEQQNVIHMGMSAKVAIEAGGDSEITVPIRAVIQRDGNTYVNVLDEKSGKTHEVAVKTGDTTLDSVVIKSNLALGEKIVVPH
jgi:HlyD family secretion protein